MKFKRAYLLLICTGLFVLSAIASAQTIDSLPKKAVHNMLVGNTYQPTLSFFSDLTPKGLNRRILVYLNKNGQAITRWVTVHSEGGVEIQQLVGTWNIKDNGILCTHWIIPNRPRINHCDYWYDLLTGYLSSKPSKANTLRFVVPAVGVYKGNQLNRVARGLQDRNERLHEAAVQAKS